MIFRRQPDMGVIGDEIQHQVRNLVRGGIETKIPPALSPLATMAIDKVRRALYPSITEVREQPGDERRRAFTYGYAGHDVPEQYIIYIQSVIGEKKTTVRALLQENISMRVESRWETIVPEKFVQSALLNVAVQATARRTLMTRWATRRIWVSTSPMVFSISLRFESENDAEKEVVGACRFLQKLCLPGESNMLFLPPGPTPFDIPPEAKAVMRGIVAPEAEVQGASGVLAGFKGEIISLRVGRFLYFPSVIVQDVTVSYDTRYSDRGLPISAKVTIVFQTYEVVTKPQLERIYEEKPYEEKPPEERLVGGAGEVAVTVPTVP